MPAKAHYNFDNILYGAACYHEYMPSERLDKDIVLMKDCGLSVVRVGESTWALFEPQVASNGETFSVSSPDGRIEIKIIHAGKIYFSVQYDGAYLINQSPVSMTLSNGLTLGSTKPISTKTDRVSREIKTLWGSRNLIKDEFNEMTFDFKDNYSLVFRVFDNGIAYRWLTRMKGEITVIDEQVELHVNSPIKGWFNESRSYETIWNYGDIPEKYKEHDIFLPLLLTTQTNAKIGITESDVYDYPGLFLRKSNDVENHLHSSFERYPTKEVQGGFNNYILDVVERADYIAKVDGNREFPWRLFVISDQDVRFADCDLVYQLARPQANMDFSWVKPGKVVWEWWGDYVIEGVDFVTGINTPTYLSQIDFAATHQVPYIIVDWKWTDRDNLLVVNPDIDIRKIIDYGKQKGVGVILWCPSFTLFRQISEVLPEYGKWGVAGVKVDFFDRDDQKSNKMYEMIAREAARYKLLVDFHGCAKPTGLQRMYPNIVNFEAVFGNEVNKFSQQHATASHTAMIPFIRGLAGPFDFTPGGFRNLHSNEMVTKNTLPYVIGTRCHEMAYYVIYNEPLKMLSDATSTYSKEMECFKMINEIPTVWDDTKLLDGAIGEYIVSARRSGDTWYVGGITNESARSYSLNCSFLPDGQYEATVFADGANAFRIATDYKVIKQTVTSASHIDLKMANEGGFVVRLQRK